MKEAIRCDIACVKPFLPMLISTVVVIDIVCSLRAIPSAWWGRRSR